MAQNPYIAGNPVGNTGAFVGRSDVMKEVQRVLRNHNQNTLVLFGQRRIGKTSILQYLESNLSQEGLYHPVYFDLQDKASYSLSHVIKELAGSISNELGIEPPKLGRNVEKSFRQSWLVSILNSLETGHSIVILFDEFDVLSEPKQDQAIESLFPYLRSLVSLAPQRLQFIFVIGRNIDDVSSITLSLFKGTPSHSVSLLTRDDAIALIRLAEKNKLLSWDKKAVEKVLELTNGHPFLTQQICFQLFEDAYEEEPTSIPKISVLDIENIVQKVLNISSSSLEWLWDGLPSAGRVVASALAEAGVKPISQDQLMSILSESGVRVVIPELREAPTLLENWDLIQPADGGYLFRVELLRQWIVKHKPLKEQIKELDKLLPIAQGLFQAAIAFYHEGQLDNAIDYLRQAITKNPNHLRANELLAEILISQNNLEEAQSVLERLLEYHPAVARPQLIDVFLSRASSAQADSEKLLFYEKVLSLADNQREALSGKQRIWKRRGDEALEVEDYSKALEAYKRAGLSEQTQNVEAILREQELNDGLQKLAALEKEDRYLEALELVKVLSSQFPNEREWSTDLKRLERNNQIAELYQRALGAIQSMEMKTARDLLVEVLEQDPEYEEASRYLHFAITGIDVQERARRIKRLTLLIIGLMILLLFISGLTFREYTHSYSLETQVSGMNKDERILAASLTAQFRDITSTGLAAQEIATSDAITAISRANATSTSQAHATSTTLALRLISDSTINNMFELRDWEFPADVNAVDFSPTSESLVAGLQNGMIYVWGLGDFNLGNEKPLELANPAGEIYNVAFSPDGEYVGGSSADKNVYIWSIATRRLYQTLEGHTANVTRLSYSPEGSFLVSASSDGNVRVWNTQMWNSFQLDFPDKPDTEIINVSAIAVSNDGKTLAVTRNWSINNTCYNYYGSYSCPDRYSGVYFFDTSDWDSNYSKTFNNYSIFDAKFLPNEPVLLYSTNAGTIYAFNSESNIEKIKSYTERFDISQGGKYIVTSYNNNRITIGRISNGEILKEISLENRSNKLIDVAFSNNGMYVASTWKNKVKLWGIPYIP